VRAHPKETRKQLQCGEGAGEFQQVFCGLGRDLSRAEDGFGGEGVA
jgi:hypothetical protein